MRKFILLLFLLCVSCTKPLGEEDPLNQPSSEAPGAFNLATIQRFDHQLLVSWSTSKGASSYELKYGTAAGTYTNSIKATKSPVVIESGLVPGTTYYFRVTASNDIGTVDSTSEKSYPYMGAPAEFALLTVLPGNSQVALTWEASPEASSYTVMYGTSAGSITTSAGNSLTTAKNVSALDNGTTYYFSVIAKNSVGNVTSTNTLSATPTPPPTVPLNPTTIADTNKCAIAWDAPASGTPIGYTVRRLTSPTTDVLACATAGFTCDDTGLAPGTYEYTVEATNASGTSPKTSAVSCAVGLPGSFQMLTASPGNGTVALTWEASNLATAHTVRYGTSVGDISTVASAAATSPYTVTGLTNMVPYYFSVTATNAQGSKLSTNTLSATPNIPPTVPLTPTVTVPEVGKCTLNWMPPASGAPPITYTVRRIVNPSVNVVICEGISTRTCSEEGLSGGTYNYTIEAINSVGTGPATGNIACSLAAPVAPTVPAVPLASMGNKKVTLTWTGGSGAASFTVKYGLTNNPTTVASTTATSPYEVTGLTNGVLHYFRVEAVNPYGTTPSAVVSATPTSSQPVLTWTGLVTTTIASMNNTTTRNFTIADPDPEDSVDCASSVTATTSDPSIVPQGSIVLGGSGTNCTIAITPAAGTSGFATVSVQVSDGQATSTTNLSVYRLPVPQRIYSWKRYGSYSGPAIRIRRAADNAETDIYFTSSGILNQVAFDNFRGGASPLLVKWYDQSGNGIDAVQTTPAKQPSVSITSGIMYVTANTSTRSLVVPAFPSAAANTIYTNYRNQDNAVRDLFSLGTHELGARSGFYVHKNTGSTGAWLVSSSAEVSSVWETTTGANSANTERGLAVIINSSSLKRDFVSSTVGSAAATSRASGTMTSYVAPAPGTPLYVFSAGTSGESTPMNGIMKELLIFDEELSTDQIKGLAAQHN
ncbi:fibronectin type III domain-containing protein [Bdellovibrio bacteriovorus]|uniref:fibronectin type III domain-containing protein n=1 Tax=Bdellovibrio bacteriovorus TaxID=959 RepID=UPI003A812D8D